MSKVVKKIGRGISKVFKGVKKVVSKAWKAIKKSPIFKTIAIAAAVYFTGGAALGAIGASGGGVGAMLSGAKAGLTAAWNGVAGAATSLAGGEFAAAGDAIAGGWSGASAAGAKIGADATATALANASAGAGTTATGTATTGTAATGGTAQGVGAGVKAGVDSTVMGGGAQTGSLTTNLNSVVGGGGGAQTGSFVNAPWGGDVATLSNGTNGGILSAGSSAPTGISNAGWGLNAGGGSINMAEPGILDKMGAFAAENPVATALIAQPVIGGVQGYAQAKAAEEEERKRIDRINAGYGAIDFNQVYTPRTYGQEQQS